MIPVARYFFWFWLLALLILNIVPLGDDTNQSLSGNKIFAFRLDYLVHAATFLVFAWIYLLGIILKGTEFSSVGVLSFAMVVISAAIGFELIQYVIPWRSFNPVDLMYNVLGAVLSICFVMVPVRSR